MMAVRRLTVCMFMAGCDPDALILSPGVLIHSVKAITMATRMPMATVISL